MGVGSLMAVTCISAAECIGHPTQRSELAPLARLKHRRFRSPLSAFPAHTTYSDVDHMNSHSGGCVLSFSQVLIDILLVLPRLLESLVSPPTSGWGLQAYITTQNTIWFAVAAAVLFGVGGALAGTSVRIPFVGDAAEQQLR